MTGGLSKCLELPLIHIEKDPIQNIVDINQTDFDNILDYLNQNLFGNELFKKRLKEELTKYRLFNRIGQQPIFSVLICGASGIGKTEVARLLHQKLASEEPMIKINFGNYSAQDALNKMCIRDRICPHRLGRTHFGIGEKLHSAGKRADRIRALTARMETGTEWTVFRGC